MQFANPAALWLLLLIIPIVALYLLKQRRLEVEVPSTLLWKQVLEDLRAQTPFQKLRTSLLLLLQILIVTLLTALLAQPYFSQSLRLSHRAILVIDTSASMQATDEKPDRFTAARNKLLALIDSAPQNDEFMLIAISSQATVVRGFTTNRAAIRSELMALHPFDLGSRWEQLSPILTPLLKEKPAPAITIASDFAAFPELPFRFNAQAVGKSRRNCAITRANIEPVAADPVRQIVFYQVQNFNSEPARLEITVKLNDEVVDAYEAEVQPMGKIDRTADLQIIESGKILITVKPADLLSIDNDLVIPVTPRQKASVRLGLNNPFLTKAVAVLPTVQASTTGSILIGNEEKEDPGIYFVAATSNDPGGRPLQWDEAHPAMRYVDAGVWRFSHYAVLHPPGRAAILAETEKGPVAYATDSQGKRKVVLGFALGESNLFLLAGFPVFLQNSIDWINDGLHPSPLELTSSEFPKEGPSLNGTYVNFLDPSESNLTPQKMESSSSPEKFLTKVRRDISSWFLIFATAVIILEWWVFHKRVSV